MSAASLEHAFRPGRIGGLALAHRILMGSMHLGIESEPDGAALAAFYAERARGGAALIFTGGAAVSRAGAGGRHYCFVNEAAEAPKLQRVARAVHDAGGRIALQLFHAGRYGSHEYFGLQPLAPSALPSRFSKSPPRAMSEEDIARTLADFADGARRARELGFDAVEIMGSEGYLLNQFLSPLTNQRNDAWGGDFVRRTRFALALVRAVREAVGPAYPVVFRISGADLMPGSTSEEETVAFARSLAALGIDAFDLGMGWHESSTPTVQYTVPPGAWLPYARRIREAVEPVPVIASTRIHALELGERALATGEADFIALARPFLADPQLVAKARAGRIEAINPCIACNQACIDRSLRDQRVSCMVNPRAGYETELREHRRAAHGAFAVVGGGPAGLEAARVLAALGHRVVLYEADSRLGGQFRLACRIPGKEDFARTVEHFERELRTLAVDVRLEHPIVADSAAELDSYDGVVVASGVAPRRIEVPGAQLAHVRAYPEAVLASAESPIAIIGAGGVGVDVAHLYSHHGQRVTLMCRGNAVGERIGRSTRWVLLRALRERGVQILTGVSYERIAPEGVWIRQRGEPPRLIEARTVVVAAGQESRDPLSAALERRGRRYRLVGGARAAGELDAVRAFREGALAAHELAAARSLSG
jgi:2,4-dienoyl-CoA reductase (NADPH2)